MCVGSIGYLLDLSDERVGLEDGRFPDTATEVSHSMSRVYARHADPPEPPPLSFDELTAACRRHFAAPLYDLTPDENVKTVWVRRVDENRSVGVQVMQVARLGLDATLSRAEKRLRDS